MSTAVTALANRIAGLVATPRPDAPLADPNARRFNGPEFTADTLGDTEVGAIVASALTAADALVAV